MHTHPHEKLNTRDNYYEPIPSDDDFNNDEGIKYNTFLKIVKLSKYIKSGHFVTYLFAVFFTISFYVFVNSSSGYILTNFLHIPKRLQGNDFILFVSIFYYLC